MFPGIHEREEGERVVVLGRDGVVVAFDDGAEVRLGEDEVGQEAEVVELGVDVEELAEEVLYAVVVDGLGVEPFEVDGDGGSGGGVLEEREGGG